MVASLLYPPSRSEGRGVRGSEQGSRDRKRALEEVRHATRGLNVKDWPFPSSPPAKRRDSYCSAAWGEPSSEKCVFLCRRRANPIRCEGFPIWETLAFSYPIGCEPMRLDAPDQLSNLVASTIRVCCQRPHLRAIGVNLARGYLRQGNRPQARAKRIGEGEIPLALPLLRPRRAGHFYFGDPQQAVEKVIFNACSLSLVSPNGGEVVGKKTVFTQGVEGLESNPTIDPNFSTPCQGRWVTFQPALTWLMLALRWQSLPVWEWRGPILIHFGAETTFGASLTNYR